MNIEIPVNLDQAIDALQKTLPTDCYVGSGIKNKKVGWTLRVYTDNKTVKLPTTFNGYVVEQRKVAKLR